MLVIAACAARSTAPMSASPRDQAYQTQFEYTGGRVHVRTFKGPMVNQPGPSDSPRR